jgi:flavorubredoxin
VWRSHIPHIVGLYDRWSRYEAEEGVVIAYASMYGNTVKMLEAVAEGISLEGVKQVRIHNVSRSHLSFILRDIWRYRGLVLGGPTYDAGLFPTMASLVSLLREKRIKGRVAGVFGSCGWSGGGVKAMEAFVCEGGLKLVEPVVEARFAANEEQLEDCIRLGRNVARALRPGSAS